MIVTLSQVKLNTVCFESESVWVNYSQKNGLALNLNAPENIQWLSGWVADWLANLVDYFGPAFCA